VLALFRFYCLRGYREQSALFVLLAVAAIVLVFTLGAHLKMGQHAAVLEDQVARLKAAGNVADKSVPADQAVPDNEALPAFSSIELVQSLNEITSELKVNLNEVGYALSTGSSEPYLRYRISLRLTAPYSDMRAFSDSLAGSLSHVVLDSISCSRQDAATVPVSCDLAFSAFYRREPHA
jgi:Tfp pilus assembly protein PilO